MRRIFVLLGVLALSAFWHPTVADAQEMRVITSASAVPAIADLLTFSRDRAEPAERHDQSAGVNLVDVSLTDALATLQARSGVRLLFSPSLLPKEVRVDCACENRTVREALQIILDGTGFGFVEDGTHTVIERLDDTARSPGSTLDIASALGRLQDARLTSSFLSAPRAAGRAVHVIRQGQIVGTVTHGDTGEPLSAVQIAIPGTGMGVLSGADGSFSLSNVPAGTHVVTAQRLGFQQLRQEGVTVTSGGTTNLDLVLRPTVLALQEIVATGLVDPVEGVRSPISVSRVDRDMMPVNVQGSALQNLQGRVAGLSMTRSSYEPGGEINVMLRSPTSGAVAFFGGGGVGDPLIVVDGVILGSSGTSGIESADIESIEVIKGAAAASLYGSRAAAGVIAITTSRGQDLNMGQTRFSAGMEMGSSLLNATSAALTAPRVHPFLMDAAQTTYVDMDGNPVDRTQRVQPPYSFMVNPYPGPTYDNTNTVFQPGSFQTQNFSLSQNTSDTNFALTLNRYFEAGIIENNRGFERGSFRVNLDHRFLDDLSVGVSAYHSRDRRDNLNLNFTTVLRAPVDVDLRQRDENGEYIRIPNPQVAYENPLWTQASRENDRTRSRTLASVNLRWDPTSWLSFMSAVSYDHSDSVTRSWIPKGIPISLTSDDESNGSLSYNTGRTDTGNVELQASLRRDFGLLNVRTTVRSLGEYDRQESVNASGTDFFVQGVPRLNAAANRSSTSEEQEIRALGFLWDNALDYAGKYIFTVLGRRDGSSLFGPDNRWHGYYRVAGAWRLGEEDWFNLPNVNEFKISFARGTAGGRPPFFAQYEGWNVTASGVSKSTLGNRNLRPEHTLEQEVSLDLILYERFGIKLTHAWQETSEQLILTDVPSFTGYSEQWINGGSMLGHTTELTLEGSLVQTPTLGWTSMVVADRSRARIGDWPGQCLNPSFRFICEGESAYALWAGRRVTSFDGPRGLDAMLGGGLVPYRDQFMLNDDGYMVWVGPGGHYADHEGKWGTNALIADTQFFWGMTFDWLDAERVRTRTQLGDASTINFGWINNFRVGQMQIHTHMSASLGGETFNTEDRALIQSGQSPKMDQSRKPRELWKPMEYYESLVPFGTPQVEPLDYLKLRALSLTYRLSAGQINRFRLEGMGISSMVLGITGRDLLTLTNFTGPDPEMGLNVANRSISTGAGYPPARTLTANVEITF